jgi:predicted hydrolase (HD superfamily)
LLIGPPLKSFTALTAETGVRFGKNGAADELTGLILASALIKPSKSASDLKLKSVKKNPKPLRLPSAAPGELLRKGQYAE